MSTHYEPPPHGFRTFLIVWATQSVSMLGSALTLFAITIWLTSTQYARPDQKPQLALALTGISLAFALPTVFGAPIAGAWADRHDRKRTMMMMDVTSGLISTALAFLVSSGSLNVPLLLVLMFGAAACSAFHGSAFDTSYAMIVPEAQLPRANGMMQAISSLSGIVSPAIAALLISLPALARQGLVPGGRGSAVARLHDGTALAMTIDALTFFAAAATLLFVFIPSPRRTDVGIDGKPQISLWADVRIGALYIWHRRPMLWLLCTFTVANFASSPVGVFEPLIVKFNLAGDWTVRGFTFVTALALLGSVGSVGGVVGGFAISAWGGLKRRRVYGVLVPMIVEGLAEIAFGLSGLLYATAAMAFVIGSMMPILNAHSQAIWQTQTPRELQGRVFAVRRVIAQFSWPLSTMLGGLATGLFNPGVVITVLGAIYTVFCTAQLFNPYLLRVEDKAYLDALAARSERSGKQIA